MTEPYLRWCAGCGATHLYETTFRMAASARRPGAGAGDALPVPAPDPAVAGQPGGEPRPLRRAATTARSDLLRGVLHLLGPQTHKQAATFLDSPVADVRGPRPSGRGPGRRLTGTTAWLLEADLAALEDPPKRVVRPVARTVRPVPAGNGTAMSWCRTRPTTRRSGPVIGRPGAVLAVLGELVGTWRPRARGTGLGIQVDERVPWSARTRAAVDAEHERLAQFRGVTPA